MTVEARKARQFLEQSEGDTLKAYEIGLKMAVEAHEISEKVVLIDTALWMGREGWPDMQRKTKRGEASQMRARSCSAGGECS